MNFLNDIAGFLTGIPKKTITTKFTPKSVSEPESVAIADRLIVSVVDPTKTNILGVQFDNNLLLLAAGVAAIIVFFKKKKC